MERCPQCESNLEKIATGSGTWYVCHHCGGKALPDAHVEHHFIDGDRSAATLMKNVQLADDEYCPGCGNLLELGTVSVGESNEVIGRCDGCAINWFPGDLGRSISTPDPIETPVGEAGSGKAEFQDEVDGGAAEQKYIEDPTGWTWKGGWGDTPSNFKTWIPAFFGLPVKLHKTDGNPVGTWLLAAVMVGVFFLAPGDLEFVKQFGFTPDYWYQLGGITALTSFFLHAGLFHLIGNVYYFIVFGQDIEQAIGTGRYLLLVFGAALFGNLIYSVIKWGSTVPSVGASGGVAGILAYFALAYPKQRFGYAFIPIIIYPIWLRLRAYWGFLIWIGLQFYGAHTQIQGLSRINALAHIGGAVVGIGFWLMLRER